MIFWSSLASVPKKGVTALEADLLQVEHGSLYPALHRLEDRGWLASFWGTSENNRKARYYRLTPRGRRQLASQAGRWAEIVAAVNRVLRPASD
jgi:transcriptional regulator